MRNGSSPSGDIDWEMPNRAPQWKDGERIRAVLEEYGIEPDKVVAAGGTAGGSWEASAFGQRYFARRRGPRTSAPERIHFDHGLRRHLAAKGLPVFAPLETRTGESSVRIDGDAYEVYPWVEGRAYEPFPRKMSERHVAVALARLHRAAQDYAAECEPLLPQFSHYPVAIPARERFDHPEVLLAAVDFVAGTYGLLRHRQELRRARDCVCRLRDDYLEIYTALPLGVIHGDYNACNLLFTAEGEVAGIFDFDWAWRDSRVRDLATGIFFFGAQRDRSIDSRDIRSLTACPRLELEPMAAFAAAYQAEYPLSRGEFEALPLALLGCWVAWRTEGVMKVPEQDRINFLLKDFFRPFRWVADVGERWQAGFEDESLMGL